MVAVVSILPTVKLLPSSLGELERRIDQGTFSGYVNNARKTIGLDSKPVSQT